MICFGDAAVAVIPVGLCLDGLLPSNLGLPPFPCSTNVPDPLGDLACFTILVPEERGELAFMNFVPEERGEIVSTVTRSPVVVRRTSDLDRERRRGGGMMGRAFVLVLEEEVVLWRVLRRGGVMTATAMREVGRDEVVVMGRGATRMSGSERFVKHIFS